MYGERGWDVLRADISFGGFSKHENNPRIILGKNDLILYLQAKKEKVRNLREMNTDAEKVKSFGEFITEDFQRR